MHCIGEFQGVDVRGPSFGHPSRLCPAACTSINDHLAPEYVRRAEGVLDGVREPVGFEVGEVEGIPLFTERVNVIPRSHGAQFTASCAAMNKNTSSQKGAPPLSPRYPCLATKPPIPWQERGQSTTGSPQHGIGRMANAFRESPLCPVTG